MKALRIILASIKKTDIDFNLFKEGSSICVGISGGKDSMALFYCLHLYKRYSNTRFNIYPMMIDLGFPNIDTQNISEYFESLGYKLYIKDAKQVYEILKIQQGKQNLNRLPCSICSKMKKAIINKVAHELNCNFVCFAHHKNDAIETLFLNEIYGGRISTFSPKMFLTNEKITFIRPFIYVDENTIKRLIKEENIPVFPSKCPNDKHTERENIKNIIKDINLKYPSSKDNFLTMMLNKEKLDIYFNHFEHKIDGTPYYISEVTNVDDFINELKFLKNYNEKETGWKHYKISINNTTIGYFKVLKNDRDFTIKLLKINKISNIDIIVYDIYKEIYDKYNPINFTLICSNDDFKKIKKVPFSLIKKTNRLYKIKIDDNPTKIKKIIFDKK